MRTQGAAGNDAYGPVGARHGRETATRRRVTNEVAVTVRSMVGLGHSLRALFRTACHFRANHPRAAPRVPRV
jgi:hypothetical protein